MILKLGLHCARKYYWDCSNNDDGLTLTYLKLRSNLARQKWKLLYYLETFVAIGLEIDYSIQVYKFIKFNECQSYYLAFAEGHSNF